MQRAKRLLLHVLALVAVAAGIRLWLHVAQTGETRNMMREKSGAETAPLRSADVGWRSRAELANELAKDDSEETFRRLVDLLKDTHDDVSYVAAEALELRGDIKFADLLVDAIPSLQRDRRWYAYRALGRYPSPRVLDVLTQAIEEELRHYAAKLDFDSRNSWYIVRSIQNISLEDPASLLSSDIVVSSRIQEYPLYSYWLAIHKERSSERIGK